MSRDQQKTLSPPGILRWAKNVAWSTAMEQWQWLHPCTINSSRHLVYHRSLARRAPYYYQRLQEHARLHGWQLKPCRRTLPARGVDCRRRLWVPLWLLAGALIATPAANAQAEFAEQLARVERPLHAMGPLTVEPANTGSTEIPAGAKLVTDAESQKKIHKLLLERWRSDQSDPTDLNNDLKTMAAYYSQFPIVRMLFHELAQYEWQLHYAAHTFSTRVAGSRLRVDSVKVYFDPRSAAQFKFNRACAEKMRFCVASPADVLLHELLHAHSVLGSPSKFIAQGGMESHMYPFAHERQTIAQEQALYVAMSAVDKLPRPLRNEHTGRPIAVACATCYH